MSQSAFAIGLRRAQRGLLLAALPFLAAAPLWGEPGCMERHLLEAIELNRARLPLYSALSGGASETISRRLIRFERTGLPVARRVDRLARRYQEHGIALVCDDFIDMADTPPFRGVAPLPPPVPAGWRPPGPAATRSAVLRAHRQGGFPLVTERLRQRLAHLDAVPGRWCMTRHIMESAARIAMLAPRHAAAARAAGLPTPTPISADLIDLHLLLLGRARQLDRMAMPLQEQGISVLCDDVPPVPYRD